MSTENLYSRGAANLDLFLNSANKEIALDSDEILRQLGVDEILRVQEAEYPEASLPGQKITHYNLPVCLDRTGFRVILPRILRKGSFSPPADEVLPLLSFRGVWIARVTNFIQRIDYADLKEEHFINCIGGAHDPESLKKIITERYKISLPMLDANSITSQGVSYTEMELISKATFDLQVPRSAQLQM